MTATAVFEGDAICFVPNQGASLPIFDTGTSLDLHLKEHVMYQRILVPVDGSSTSQRGLEEAIRVSLPTDPI